MQAVYLFEKLVVLAEAYKSVFHIAYCGAMGGHFFRWRKMEGMKGEQ